MKAAQRRKGATIKTPLAGKSLTDTLADLGFAHAADPTAIISGPHIITRDGVEVFCGTAGETWAWLREQGLIQ